MRSLADAARAAGEHIRSLRAEGGPPEGMLLPALRAVVAAAGAAAGAVCRLEPEVEALRLAAEVGLSDEGCRHLRWLRPDGPWDVPLRSLREQRAQVSDPASGGPASPPLVEPVGARAVACIPLFAGAIPAGTLVLVGDPHAFDRACLDDLEPAAEELAAVLAAIPEPSAGEGVGAPRPADEPSWLWGLAESACRSLAPALQELGSLVGRIRPAAGDAAVGSPPPVIGSLAPRESLLEAMAERALQRIRPAVEELAAVVEGTRRRVTRAALPVRGTVASLGYGGGGVETAALAEVTEERDRLAAERAELALAQVALEQARAAEVGGLMARLAEAEAVMVRERERVGELERAQEGLIAELAEAITRELRTREEAQALAARAAADREETLQRARESTQAAESARAAAAVEAEALRTALAQAQTLIMEAEDDARAARAACDLLQGAEQVRSAERDQLAHDLEEARARAVEDAGRLTRLEREIGALHEERLRLQASGREREAEIAAEWTARLSEHEAALARTRERVLELERAHDLLAERLAAAVSREERAQEELQAVTARAAAGREETLARARESTQAAESARAAAAAEAEALRAALAQAQAVIMEAEDQARQARVREDEARAELGRLEQDLRAAQEERNRLEVAAHEKERTLRAHWTARLSDRETTATQQREQIAALEAAQAELVRDLGAAAAREQRAREELEALAARAAADREETLARARESTQAAESARAAAAAEAEALRAALAQAQAVIME
ncbi:MAG TPA: hypothetical protein VKW76_03395, partial [Candidatus Binatia bacterium]|nr:hypothetical protein [Candidatus Binatia bacterium]